MNIIVCIDHYKINRILNLQIIERINLTIKRIYEAINRLNLFGFIE